MKTCKECGLGFPIDAFPKSGNKGTGRRARCRPCHNARENRLRLQHAAAAGQPYKPRVRPDPSSGARLCRTCEQMQPLDQFAKGQRECRTCRSERNARYRAANADKEAERHRRYHAENRETLLPKFRMYQQRAYYRDPERFRAGRRDSWRRMTAEQRQEFYRQNREARQVHSDMRRARVIGTTVEPIRRAAIIDRDHRTCYLCGRDELTDRQIHLDHVVPLSRGGTHTADNIRVACRRCNYRKANRLLSELDLSQFVLAS
jgi:5-methylcytosine-specific restriction endonuclease McrA